jgi:hypothetical protein
LARSQYNLAIDNLKRIARPARRNYSIIHVLKRDTLLVEGVKSSHKDFPKRLTGGEGGNGRSTPKVGDINATDGKAKMVDAIGGIDYGSFMYAHGSFLMRLSLSIFREKSKTNLGPMSRSGKVYHSASIGLEPITATRTWSGHGNMVSYR